MAETPYRAIVQSEVKPFRGLLLGFFFISGGMSLDRQTLLHAWPAVLAVAALLVAAKVILNAAASLAFRWSVPGSTQLGFLLAQGSEFAFVIFSLPSVRALVGERASAVLIAAVALSLAATPSIAEAGRSLAGRMQRDAARAAAADPELIPRDMPGPVFIVGMGRRGRAVADALTEFSIGYAAVERDERRLREAVADGYAVAFGDVGDPRLWEAVAMGERRISVITAPSLEVSTQLTPIARTFFPDLKRIAAVADAEAGAGFAALGLLPVVDGGPVPGVALAVAVLAELGVNATRIAAWAIRQRERASGPLPEALAVAA